MKKILPVIIGIISGLIISFSGIYLYKINVAYGELNWWNEVTAFGNFFDWKDVFGSYKGKDLYKLLYSKRFVLPEKNALTDVAKKYGLTTIEAKSVVGGSIVPLLNTTYKRSVSMTQEDAMQIMQNVQESYNVLNEAYQLQQEADTSIRPSELFSNNDLSDSGFDLIYDLSKIEEVLFVNVVENTIGKPYIDTLKSPYVPTQDDYKMENYVANETDVVGGYKMSDKNSPVSNSGDSTGSGSSGVFDYSGIATMTLGDKNVTANVLEEDACAQADKVSSALDAYDKENSSGGSGSGSDISGVGDQNTSGNSSFKPSSDDQSSGQSAGKNTTQENLAPAPKDQWEEVWCDGLPNDGSSYSGLGTVFGDSGFTSLGDTVNSLLSNPSGNLAGAGVGFSNKAFSAQASVCVTYQFIKKTLTSYYPGKSCILCEVSKINEILKKTLSHSLVPNKVTGNLMESAKCKDAIEVPLVDMKFVLVKAPIPTPVGSDMILGKNIFESWKKFIDRYQPLLFEYLEVGDITSFEMENAPSGATQQKIYSDIQKEIATSAAQAKSDLRQIKDSEVPMNTALYAQALIKELDFMTQTFSNYKNLFEQTSNVCQEWGKKPNIK